MATVSTKDDALARVLEASNKGGGNTDGEGSVTEDTGGPSMRGTVMGKKSKGCSVACHAAQ